MALKPLEDALRDGDTIRAVVRGTGTNQDGNAPIMWLDLYIKPIILQVGLLVSLFLTWTRRPQ